MKVLVVDDESSYRHYVGHFLAREGHEVRLASSGREAIQDGARFRPDVLVVDWMLKNHVHGLHVVDALGVVWPEMATVLITGFPSRDLQASAERAGVVRFVEKPFEVEEIRDAVEQAAGRRAVGHRRPLALVEADAQGRIQYANPRARVLFRAAGAPQAETLEAVLGDAMPSIEAASRGWEPTHPQAWCLRTQPPRPDGSRLWLIRRDDEHVEASLVEMILGVAEVPPVRWPHEGRVLVVDDDELFRHVAVAILESAGAACYAVETDEEAVRLLEHDAGFRVAVVDHDIGGGDVGSLIERIRSLRPEIQVVGNSALPRQEEFAKHGVRHFLRKPWRPADLAAALTGPGD